MGDRKAVIRTGYGAEGVVPDIIAGRIIRSSNQYFKGGDTDGGVADAVGNLSYLLTTPGATEELMSKYANDRRRGGEETIDFFGIWIKISMFIAALMLIFFIITLVSTVVRTATSATSGYSNCNCRRSLSRLPPSVWGLWYLCRS